MNNGYKIRESRASETKAKATAKAAATVASQITHKARLTTHDSRLTTVTGHMSRRRVPGEGQGRGGETGT